MSATPVPPPTSSGEATQALLERALAAAGEGIVIADARQPDLPLIYVNRAFEAVTGYAATEVLGRNCRFLQGPDTDREAVEVIRRALRERRGCVVELLNYRKDGTQFWNRLSITPVTDAAGEVTHFIGVQSDITAKRLAQQRLQAANRRMRRDLEAAARIQKSLLPAAPPVLRHARVAWAFLPCEELAGDTLNVLQLDEDTLALYVLDVSGHGVPAALLSFTLAHTLSAFPDQSCLYDRVGATWVPAEPAAVLAALNRRFQLDPTVPQYFTLFYALVEPASRRVRYASAGHPPAILAPREGDPAVVAATGPPIGLVEGAAFEQAELRVAVGDRLFVFTDGLLETENPEHVELGIERIVAASATHRELALQGAVDALVALATDWSGGVLRDDISVCALEMG